VTDPDEGGFRTTVRKRERTAKATKEIHERSELKRAGGFYLNYLTQNPKPKTQKLTNLKLKTKL